MNFQDQLAADLGGVFFSDFAIDAVIAGVPVKALYLDDPTKWEVVQCNGKALSVPDGPHRFRSGDVVEIPAKGIKTTVRAAPIRQDGLMLIPLK